MRIVSTWLVLLIAVTLASGQNKEPLDLPGAELFDEFGELPCGFLGARSWAVRSELIKRPGTRALFVIHPNTGNQLAVVYRERLVLGEIGQDGFDLNRIFFVRSKPESRIRTIVYIVPENKPIPLVEAHPLDLRLPTDKEAFIFEQSGSFVDDDLSYCESASGQSRYVEILLANPLAEGKIRIAAENRAEFQKKKEDLIETLSPVSPDRLVFEHVVKDKDGEEFWIVPKKAK